MPLMLLFSIILKASNQIAQPAQLNKLLFKTIAIYTTKKTDNPARIELPRPWVDSLNPFYKFLAEIIN